MRLVSCRATSVVLVLPNAPDGKSELTGCEAVLAHCDRCGEFERTVCVVMGIKGR
jgi:hypothetical protein